MKSDGALSALVVAFMLLAAILETIDAQTHFPFPCAAIGCRYCTTQRMQLACGHFCNRYCRSDQETSADQIWRPTTTTTTTPTTTTSTTTSTTTIATTEPTTITASTGTSTTRRTRGRSYRRCRPLTGRRKRQCRNRIRNRIRNKNRNSTATPRPRRPRVKPTRIADNEDIEIRLADLLPNLTDEELVDILPTLNLLPGLPPLPPQQKQVTRPPTTTPMIIVKRPRSRTKTRSNRRPKSNRNRARGSTGSSTTKKKKKKQKCPKSDWSPCVKNREANNRFKSCCKREKLPAGCYQICKYGLPRSELEKVFIWSRQCPPEMIPHYLYCASGGQDARPCCKAKGLTNGAFKLCTPFCNPAGGLPGFNVGQIACLQNMDEIQKCYQAVLKPKKRRRRPANSRRRTTRRRTQRRRSS